MKLSTKHTYAYCRAMMRANALQARRFMALVKEGQCSLANGLHHAETYYRLAKSFRDVAKGVK